MGVMNQIDALRVSEDDETSISTLRTPPQNIEAEMALLGSILANNKIMETVSDFLRADHFSDGLHKKIYSVITTLIEKGQVASPVTVSNYLDKDEMLKQAGGKAYIAHLAGALTSVLNVKDYAQLIYDLYLRRELIDLGQAMVNEAYEVKLETSAIDHIEGFEQKLYHLAEEGVADKGFLHVNTAVIEAIKTAENAFKRDSSITGITTGLSDLDKKLGGMHPSDLVILAGRPSMGKTALAMNFAYNAASAYREEYDDGGNQIPSEGGRVAFFSLEMSAEQLAMRLLAGQTGISADKIRRGEIKGSDFEKFVEASHHLSQIPLYIDDTPGLTVTALRNRARRLKRKQGLDYIFVDYLQLLQAPAGGSENRVQAVSEITRGLKILAKELHVPVIALSQLSRGPEQRDDKRPQLADLRESGSIEQDADVVMFIFREEYYLSREEPSPGTDKHRLWQESMARVHNISEIIVSKQRHGPIGTVKAYFDGAHTKFVDLQRNDALPEGM